MMTDSPRLGVTYLEQNQSQKHVTVNEALRRYDALIQLHLKSITETTPPASPSDGDVYWVPSGASGNWASRVGKIAAYHDGSWRYYDSQPGYVGYIEPERRIAVYDTTLGWVTSLVRSPFGATMGLGILEEEMTLSGASTASTIQIPNRAIVAAVSERVTETITGATSFDLGDGTIPDRFGGLLGLTAGSTNIGVIGPTAYYTPTPIVATASGGGFTAGKIRIAIQYWEFSAATS